MSDNPYAATIQEPVAPQPPQRSVGNGFGIASLILGILTMVGFAIPFLNYATIATGVIGVVLGIVGLVIKFRPRKAAVAGVILSGLGLVLSIILAVVYTAVFAGAAEAVSKATVPPAGTSSSAAPADSSAEDTSSATASFKDGVLTTPEMKIQITSHRVIPVGQPGNEYGDKPVLAFVYSTTNLTDKKLDPSFAWIGSFEAFQDNDPNAVNKLDIGLTPGDQYADTQLESIKNGGTVENAVAYELDDTTTPVKLTAKENIFGDDLGSVMYEVQ